MSEHRSLRRSRGLPKRSRSISQQTHPGQARASERKQLKKLNGEKRGEPIPDDMPVGMAIFDQVAKSWPNGRWSRSW